MHDPEKSRLRQSSREADEQSRATGCGAGGAKAGDQGERGSAKATHRTQSRARVTQALDRVRKAARQRKKGQVHRAPPPSSMPTRSGRRFTRLSAKPPPAWMA